MPFSRLIVERRPDNTWRLHRPFTYRGRTRTVTVPAGFPTDFASIPRLFWRILPKNGPYDFAAVPHDYLYTVQILPRPEADHLFLEAMEAAGVVPWQRRLMFWAVRLFGWLPWRLHKKRKQSVCSCNPTDREVVGTKEVQRDREGSRAWS